MKEFRCKKCNRLLGKVKGIAEIKCPKCATVNTVKDR
ncbi:zinc finger domain-containing protein [Halalkalibacterium ligniniphilum]